MKTLRVNNIFFLFTKSVTQFLYKQSHFKLISDVHLNIYSMKIELNLENFIKNPVLIKKRNITDLILAVAGHINIYN